MTGSYSLRAYVFTNFCGIGIKRDSLYYQYKGCGAVPQSRSTREVVILDRCILEFNIQVQSLTTLSSHLTAMYISFLSRHCW